MLLLAVKLAIIFGYNLKWILQNVKVVTTFKLAAIKVKVALGTCVAIKM